MSVFQKIRDVITKSQSDEFWADSDLSSEPETNSTEPDFENPDITFSSAGNYYPYMTFTEKDPVPRRHFLIDTLWEYPELPTEERLQKEKLIFDRMRAFPFLPFNISSCNYISDWKAWSEYDVPNVRALMPYVNTINSFLSDFQRLPRWNYFQESLGQRRVPTDYRIAFTQIDFGFHPGAAYRDLPRSYLIFNPLTKAGKASQYPLIAYFATRLNDFASYFCELYFAINGDLAKAKLHCLKNGNFNCFDFSVIGQTFTVSRITGRDYPNRKVVLYDARRAYNILF